MLRIKALRFVTTFHILAVISSSNNALLRKLIGSVSMKLALWTLLLLVPAVRAATITCNAGATSIPVFNPTSVLGAVGDYTLDCADGMTGTPIVVNFGSFMNVPVLNTGVAANDTNSRRKLCGASS